MEIRKIPIEKLNPAAYNPRKDLQPGDPEYEKLKRSMQEFGFSFMENDDNREEILQVCFRLIDICDEVWIYGDSEGCRSEAKYAKSVGKPVRMVMR
jgi:hypothetical protein